MGTPSLAARSLRQKQRISYYEPEEPNFDEYVYCEECNDFVYEYCAIHGPLLVIPDDKVPLKSEHPPIVPRAALTIPHVFLHLARSNIPGAGIGVFSTLTLPRGVRFGPYRGERVTGVDSAYCWQMYDGNNKPSYVIDAADASRSNWMRYVNCARGWLEQNLVAYQYQGQLYYRTIKIIPRFSELLVFYGGEFARSLGVDLRHYNAPPLYAPRIGPPKKKKPRFEPPTKKTGEDTTKETAALIDVSAPVNLPTTVQDYDAGCGKIDDKNKCKAKVKSGNAKSKQAVVKKVNEVRSGKIDDKNKCKAKVKSVKAKSKQVIVKDKVKLDYDQNQTESKNITEQACEKPDVKMLNIDAKPKTVTQSIVNELNTTQTFKSVAIEENNNFSTFICNECNDKFNTKPKLQQHILSTHNSTKNLLYRCQHCSYETATNSYLERHLKLHDIKRKHGCNICLFRFKTNTDLKRHMISKHETGDKKHSCDICEYKTYKLSHLDLHLKKHAGVKSYACTLCSYKSNQNSNLKQHMRTHTGEKPFACNVCTYKCNQSSYLKAHMRTHTGEKPFACNLCTYRCIQSINLKIHIRTHTGESLYACNQCSYKCNQISSLKRHMRTHTGEKPFACNLCTYKCNQSSHLKDHMRTHTGEKPYACNICSYKCSVSSSLKQHMRTHENK